MISHLCYQCQESLEYSTSYSEPRWACSCGLLVVFHNNQITAYTAPFLYKNNPYFLLARQDENLTRIFAKPDPSNYDCPIFTIEEFVKPPILADLPKIAINLMKLKAFA